MTIAYFIPSVARNNSSAILIFCCFWSFPEHVVFYVCMYEKVVISFTMFKITKCLKACIDYNKVTYHGNPEGVILLAQCQVE